MPRRTSDLAEMNLGDLIQELRDTKQEALNLRFRNATDGLIALRAGYPTAMLGSVNALKLPDNYHWPTDVPANVDLGTVADAVTVCDVLARRLSSGR